jgi:hypothetical protein
MWLVPKTTVYETPEALAPKGDRLPLLRASFGKPRPDPNVAPQGIRAGNPCPVSAMNGGKIVVLRWCLPFYQTPSKSVFGKGALKTLLVVALHTKATTASF